MKVICYGDSNTWGYDPRGYFGGRYDESWPELLARKSGWNIRNQGANGREIPCSPVEFPADTNLLIIMLGTNDLLQGNVPELVAKRMEAFLKKIDLEVLLIAPPSMIPGEWVPTKKLITASRELAKQYRTLSQNLGIRFVDADDWNIPLAFDGIHFTEKGHSTFSEGIYNFLIKDGT